jgi:hypothetical protein
MSSSQLAATSPATRGQHPPRALPRSGEFESEQRFSILSRNTIYHVLKLTKTRTLVILLYREWEPDRQTRAYCLWRLSCSVASSLDLPRMSTIGQGTDHTYTFKIYVLKLTEKTRDSFRLAVQPVDLWQATDSRYI